MYWLKKYPCLIIITFLSLIFFQTHAQENNPLINSGEIIANGVKLHDAKKYKEAIEEYKKIDRSDTNYSNALYELSYSYYTDSQQENSLKYARLGMSLFPSRFSEFSLQAANSLDDMGRSEEALKLYDSALNRSPYSFISYFNKGLVYYTQKNYEEAKKNFQRCLMINPYYSSAHYFLGKLYLFQGNLVPAVLSLNTYLLIVPSGKYFSNTLTALSSLAKVSDEIIEFVKNKPNSKEDDFSMQQDILLSKLALDKQYKLKVDLEDNIIRQIQVMLEKLEYNKKDRGFCMQFYVPFYANIMRDGDFDAMVFSTFAGVNSKSIENWNKDNKKKKQVFVDKASAYFDAIKRTQILDPEQRENSDLSHIYSNQTIIGKGLYTKDKDPQPVGKWEYYFENGALKATGNFTNAGQKDAVWFYYYDNGELKEKSNYVNGLLTGLTEGWFDNGNKWYSETYVDGKATGIQTINYYNEKPKSITVFKDGVKNGDQKLYDFKGLHTSTSTYADDKLEGWSRSYYPDGKITNEVLYRSDKEEGLYKSYYNSGSLYLQGEFRDGKRQGLWTTYFEDGKISEKTVYVDNEITGEFTEYFSNGKLMRKGTYYKKKIDDKLENFDDDEKLFSELIYDRGKLKEVNFYDKSGKNISTTTTRKGAANIIFYTPEGIKSSEGYFNKDGNKDGKFVTYYNSGKVNEESNWKEGVKNGIQINYFPDGKINKTTSFKDGEEDGYVKEFYPNGTIRSEGWRAGGKRQQHYLYYNTVGDLTTKEYYVNEELKGYSDYFLPGNIHSIEYFYNNGWLISLKQFDTTAKVISNNNFEKGKGPLVYKHLNGQKSVIGNYDHYMLNGPYVYYFFDGSVSVKSFYKNDMSDSIYKDYYYGGILRTEGKFNAGIKEGKWKYYYHTGKIRAEETYVNGSLEGINKIYNPDGSLDKTVTYKKNELHGPCEIYGDKNLLAVRLNYKDDIVKSYQYEEKPGSLTAEIPLISSTGKVVAKYSNGKQSTSFSFIENRIEAERKIFYSNGNIYVDGNRLYGDNHGFCRTYYSNGSPWEEENYVMGSLHGTSKYYYPNGKLEREENFYNNENHGESKYYDEQGKLKQTFTYYHGNLLSVK